MRNKPSIPKEIRIGYTIERVEQYIQAPRRCFKCQKFGHYKEICRGRQICDKCSEHDPDHMENERKNIKCANCHEEYPAFSRSCAIYKREKEIMFIKQTKNIPFPEARKIVESYIGTKTYANVAQKVNQPPQDSTSINKYKKLIEKLINLKANEWLTFQENLKRMHSTEMKERKPCIKTKVDTNTNTEENSKTSEQIKKTAESKPENHQRLQKKYMEKLRCQNK